MMTNDPVQDAPSFHADHTPYEAMGGEKAVRALANVFYSCMDTANVATRSTKSRSTGHPS